MTHRLAVLLTLVIMLLGVSYATASDFENPLEVTLDPGKDQIWTLWDENGDYQRNAMVDFATDPGTWPGPDDNYDDLSPITYTDAADLSPTTTGYDLQGYDDDKLYLTDWLAVNDPDGTVDWTNADIFEDSSHTGILYAQHPGDEGDPDITVDFYWHIDNWAGGREKHFYDEIWYYTAGPLSGLTMNLISSDGQVVDLFDPANFVDIAIIDEWIRVNSYAKLIPNPSWEILKISAILAAPNQGSDPGTFAIDSMHVATECPEPGTFALFGLGGLGLIAWRRRRTTE